MGRTRVVPFTLQVFSLPFPPFLLLFPFALPPSSVTFLPRFHPRSVSSSQCLERKCKFFQWIEDSSADTQVPPTSSPVTSPSKGTKLSAAPVAPATAEQPRKLPGTLSRVSGPQSKNAPVVTLSLAGRGKFSAKSTKPIDGEFQKIAGGRRDEEAKTWVYPIESYDSFVAHFGRIHGFVVIPLSAAILQLARSGLAKDQAALDLAYDPPFPLPLLFS